MFKRFFLTCAFLLIASNAWAATKYARAGGGNWSSDATWSTTSGGGADTTKCVAADACYLDGSSGNVTVDAASAAGSLTCTGYTGTLTLGANLTVSGSITLVSGMTFTPSTYTVIFGSGASGGTGTVTSAGKSFYNFTIGYHSTLTLGDNMTVTNLLRTYTYSSAGDGVTINGSAYTLSTAGWTTGDNGGNIDGDLSKVIFNGTGTWTGGNSVIKHNIDINTAGTLTATGTIYLGGGKTLKYYGGTYTSSSETIQVFPQNNYTFDIEGISINNYTQDYQSTVTLSSDLDVVGTCSLRSYTSSEITINGHQINVKGGFDTGSYPAANINGTVDFVVTGTANQAWAGGTGTIKQNITINKSGGTLTLSNTTKFSTGTITYTAGTVDAGTSTLSIAGSCTLNCDGIDFYNITHSTASTVTLSSDLTLTNTLAVNSNTVYSGAYNVHAQGPITRDTTARTLTSANTTLLLDGGANQAIGTTNGMNFLLPVTVNKSGNTATMAAEIDFGNGTNTPTFTLTSAQSTLAWGTSLLKCIANANLNCGTVYQLQVSTAGTTTLTGNVGATSTVTVDASRTLALGSNTLTLQGDLVATGTLNCGTGTVSISGGTNATQTISGGNISFYDFSCIAPAVNKTLTFDDARTYTFQHNLTLISAYGGNSLTINSDSAGTQTSFDIDVEANQQIERCVITDNEETNGWGHNYKGTNNNTTGWDAEGVASPATTAWAFAS